MRGFDVMSICLGWLVCAGLVAGGFGALGG